MGLPAQRALEGSGDRRSGIVGAPLAPGKAVEAERNVGHGHGHNGEIAREGFLDGVGGALFPRGEHQRVAGAHVKRHFFVRHAPADHQLRPKRVVHQLDGLTRQLVPLARVAWVAQDQDGTFVERPAGVQASFPPREAAERFEIEPGRYDVRRDGAAKVALQVCGDQDGGVGLACHESRQPLQQPPGRRWAAVFAEDAEQIVAPKRHDQGQTLGEGEQAALTELGVDEVVAMSIPRQATSQPRPRGEVAQWASTSTEGEHIDVDARRPEEAGLARDEVRGVARVAGPLARDHQYPQRCRVHTCLLGAGRGTRPPAGAARWLCSRYSMKALSMSSLSNSCSAVRRPLAPNSCRSAASAESVRSASTRPWTSPGATTIPTRCSRTNAAGSPPATSTTGLPLAMASYSLDGVAPGMCVASGTTRMSAAATSSGIWSLGRGGRKRTLLRARASARWTSFSFAGPSPTSTMRRFGSARSVSAASST